LKFKKELGRDIKLISLPKKGMRVKRKVVDRMMKPVLEKLLEFNKINPETIQLKEPILNLLHCMKKLEDSNPQDEESIVTYTLNIFLKCQIVMLYSFLLDAKLFNQLSKVCNEILDQLNYKFKNNIDIEEVDLREVEIQRCLNQVYNQIRKGIKDKEI